MRRLLPVVWVAVTGCGFHPTGLDPGEADAGRDAPIGDDAPEADAGDPDAATIDAAMIDAPTDAAIDAPSVDAPPPLGDVVHVNANDETIVKAWRRSYSNGYRRP